MMFRWGKQKVKNSGAWQFLQSLWSRVAVPTTSVVEFYTTYQLPVTWATTHAESVEWQTTHVLPATWQTTHAPSVAWEV